MFITFILVNICLYLQKENILIKKCFIVVLFLSTCLSENKVFLYKMLSQVILRFLDSFRIQDSLNKSAGFVIREFSFLFFLCLPYKIIQL